MTALTSVEDALTVVRQQPRYHWTAVLFAVGLGLAFATVHWVGLVVGGALVGLVSSDLLRAVLAGFGFGLLAVTLWVGLLWWAGSLGAMLAMGEIALVSVAIGLGGPVVGSLVRGVV